MNQKKKIRKTNYFLDLQVLSRAWIPKWASLINMPLGLTTEMIQSQLLARPEFDEETSLSKHDQAIVTQIRAQFVPEIKYAT